MYRPKTLILAVAIIVVAGGILRIFYAIDIPLSGDETVSLLQASGQAVGFKDRLPKENVPITEIKKFVSYSKDFSTRDVLRSLRYADKHPPFYFLLLRYVLKYMGNDSFTVRLTSIFLSLLSVVLIYRVGKTIYDENIGLYSALFLGISAYGITYGAVVRPYPLAMLVSLVSTLQVYELSKGNQLSLSSKKLFLYAITVLAGLYTVYYFLFIFIFQIAFLLMANFRNKKALPAIITIVGIVLVLYLPWAPSSLDQVKKVMHGERYFHGTSSFLSFVDYIIRTNFAKQTSYIPLVAIKTFIAVIICAITLIGCYFSLRDKTRRVFILAFAVYLLSGLVADKILNTRTLTVGKLFFFVMPVFFILLASGIARIPSRYRLRKISLLFCCGLLLCKSIAVCYYKPGYDGPNYMRPFRDSISKSLKPSQKGLVIVNTAERRLLFPLAHAIENPVDMKIMRANKVETEMPSISNFEDYDLVFITNCYNRYAKRSFFSYSNIKNISNYLNKYGFRLIEPSELEHKSGKSSVYVFRKQPALGSMFEKGNQIGSF